MAEQSADGRSERTLRAFNHAVEHELNAIRLHEQAARRHQKAAASYEDAVLHAVEGVDVERLVRLAAAEHARARAASGRAETCRSRLRAEGVDVGDGP